MYTLQIVCPAPSVYVPFGHFVHVYCPSFSEMYPGSQSKQFIVPDGEYCPAGHLGLI